MFDRRVLFTGEVNAAGTVVERVQLLGAEDRFLTTAINGTAAPAFAFRLEAPCPVGERIDAFRLRALLEDGTRSDYDRIADRSLADDPYHLVTRRFFDLCRERGQADGSTRALEIGARARSGVVRRRMVEPMNYVGLDIVPGENADIVGDAHRLSDVVDPGSFDAVFAMSTFEHLAMPWKVAVEINRVLKPGGLVFVSSHQTFPLHDAPWDFWRFSDSAWRALFHPGTGFRIIDSAMGEPAMIVANVQHTVTADLAAQPTYLGSAVLAEKISETKLDWPIRTSDVLDTEYPG